MKFLKLFVVTTALCMAVTPAEARSKKSHSRVTTQVQVKESQTTATTTNKKAEIKANLEQARESYDDGDYAKAKNYLNQVLAIEAENYDAIQLLYYCNEAIEEELKEERAAYEEVCKTNTEDDLTGFLNQYPNSTLCSDVRNRLSDYRKWQQAQAIGSRQAVENYLESSTLRLYEQEAQQELGKIQCAEDWQAVSQYPTKASLQEFINRHPSSPFEKEANYQLNIINADELYSYGNYEQALKLYEAAQQFKGLPIDTQEKYQQCLNGKRFNSLNANNVTEISNFLQQLTPASQFYSATSNMLAVAMARGLDKTSTDEQMKAPLSYATDAATTQTVKGLIATAKAARKAYRSEVSAVKRHLWWEDRITVGLTVIETDAWRNSLSYSGGLKVRFGRHNSVANVILGANYTWQGEHNLSSKESGEDAHLGTISHMITVPAALHFNLPISHRSSMYLGGEIDLGLIVKESDNYVGNLNKKTLAWKAQLGFAGRHYDFGMYYKHYIKNNDIFTADAIKVMDAMGIEHDTFSMGLTWTLYF